MAEKTGQNWPESLHFRIYAPRTEHRLRLEAANGRKSARDVQNHSRNAFDRDSAHEYATTVVDERQQRGVPLSVFPGDRCSRACKLVHSADGRPGSSPPGWIRKPWRRSD